MGIYASLDNVESNPEWSGFFKLLADETRLRLLVLLAQDDLCVCQLCGILDLSQPKVSKHLAKLRDRGLVRAQRRDRFVYYSLSLQDSLQQQVMQKLIEMKKLHPVLCKDAACLEHKDQYPSYLLQTEAKDKS